MATKRSEGVWSPASSLAILGALSPNNVQGKVFIGRGHLPPRRGGARSRFPPSLSPPRVLFPPPQPFPSQGGAASCAPIKMALQIACRPGPARGGSTAGPPRDEGAAPAQSLPPSSSKPMRHAWPKPRIPLRASSVGSEGVGNAALTPQASGFNEHLAPNSAPPPAYLRPPHVVGPSLSRCPSPCLPACQLA